MLPLVCLTTACAHAGGPKQSSYGTYRFSDAIPGLGVVSGEFEVGNTGRVTQFSGRCSPPPATAPGMTSVDCRVQRVTVAGHDDGSVKTVAVRVLLRETTQAGGDQTRSQVRQTPFTGHVGATRVR
jgi:hypothetical protein